MSVINWGADELGNVARYLAPTNGGPYNTFQRATEALAVVSRANVEEFLATHKDRHGTPVPLTASEIAAAAPRTCGAELALGTLGLLDYNANAETPALKLEVAQALVSLLTMALNRTEVFA